MIGKKVIIRADRAGVFYGVLKEKKSPDNNVMLPIELVQGNKSL